MERLHETEHTQHHHTSCHTHDEAERAFHRLVGQGPMDAAVLAAHNRSHRVAYAQHEHAELLRDAALALDPDTRCTS